MNKIIQESDWPFASSWNLKPLCFMCVHLFSFFVPLAVIRFHSFLFVVTRCHSLVVTYSHSFHSLSFVVPLVVMRCHSLSLFVPLLVTRCHSLSVDVPLVCLFINDPSACAYAIAVYFVLKNVFIETIEFSYKKKCIMTPWWNCGSVLIFPFVINHHDVN